MNIRRATVLLLFACTFLAGCANAGNGFKQDVKHNGRTVQHVFGK